jgi:hypothetical protein
MAQIEATGGGISYTADGKKLTKQVYVLTDGTTTVSPSSVANATITSADFVRDAAGVTRVTVTWTEGMDSSGGGGSAGGGATTELIGGAREIPTEAHPTFKDSVSDSALKEIKSAIQDGRDPDTALVPTGAEDKARILYRLLLRGQEYYLAPAVSYRQTTLETALPTLRELCTVNAPQRAPGVGTKQNWLLTSINARSVAQPTGAVRYEVTKEWMLSDRNGWDPELVIYDGT